VIPGAHIVLHLALCSAMMQGPQTAQETVHVKLLDRINKPHLNRDFTFERYSNGGTVEFDAPQGLYQMQIYSPQLPCAAVDWLFVIAGHDRTISEQLTQIPPPVPHPMLITGTAPQSFLYLQPSYVLFPMNEVACDKPVPDPLPARITIEDDQDSFYIWMYSDPTLVAKAPLQLALQLQTPTGDYHYIRLKVPFPVPWQGMPYTIQFNVSEGEVDWLAGQPTGVLLCPRLFRTSAG